MLTNNNQMNKELKCVLAPLHPEEIDAMLAKLKINPKDYSDFKAYYRAVKAALREETKTKL